MKKLIAFCFMLFAVTAFAQTPDTLTPEKNARYKIGRIRDNVVRAITPQDFRNAFNSVANLAVKRVPYLTVAELRAGKADTATVVNLVRNNRVWMYRYNPGSSVADDSTMNIKSGSRVYTLVADIITPSMFGAVGDSATNDTKAIQKCIDYARENTIIDFQGLKYRFDSVTLAKPYVSLRGSGAKLTGIIKVGDNTMRNYNAEISGFTFDLAGDPIKIMNARKVTIIRNVFNGSVRAVHFVAGPTGTHYNGINKILYNTFNDVSYCLYIARASGATWQVNSDCSFIGNTVNAALITAIYIDGIDGFDCVDNVFFTPSDLTRRVNKKYHLQVLGQSDWITVGLNKFFESGEESLHFTNCKNLVVSANSFAWSGQKGVYPVISLNGTIDDYSVAVTGNTFKYFSGDVVASGASTYGLLNVSANVVYYANTFTNYFGATDLSTIDHFVVNSGNVNNVVREDNTYRVSTLNLKSQKIGTNVKKYQRLQLFSSTSSKRSELITSGATPIDVGGIQNGNISTGSYGGKIHIVAKQAETTSANSAFYELTITKANSGASPTITVVSSGGLTAGAGASHPSFTFTVVGDRLLATPVASTAGTFYLHMQTQGDLTLAE